LGRCAKQTAIRIGEVEVQVFNFGGIKPALTGYSTEPPAHFLLRLLTAEEDH
jgi:hypothetical protein